MSRIIDARTMLEALPANECWDLIAGEEVGRVAVLVAGEPEIYPVNHVVDGKTIVFRTAKGSKLDGLLRSPSVCFEVDGISPATRSGWSVLVKGRAQEIRGGAEVAALARLPLQSWVHGDKEHWIRVTPDHVTGRRIHHRSGT